jgi:hypothetical protein
MQRRVNLSLSALVVVALMLAGCGDRNPIGPDPDPPVDTSIAFSYSGERAGSFRVEGGTPTATNGDLRLGTWASGLRASGFPLNVMAVRVGTAPMTDVFVLVLQNITAPGTYTLSPTCSSTTQNPCTMALLAFGYDWNAVNASPEREYRLAGGSVTVTSMDANRIRGTFSSNAFRFPEGNQALTVTGGTFDVPIVNVTSVPQQPTSSTGILFDPLDRILH